MYIKSTDEVTKPFWKICDHVNDMQIFIGVCAFEMQIVSQLGCTSGYI